MKSEHLHPSLLPPFEISKTSLNATDGSTAWMLILNLSPDSFSRDGCSAGASELRSRLLSISSHPPDFLDVGAVSTRPGSQPVSPEEEWKRLRPACAPLRSFVQRMKDEQGRNVQISLDTSSPTTVERVGNELSLSLINDVFAGRKCEGGRTTLQVAARENLGMILMHMQGEPGTMQDNPSYGDCVNDVLSFLEERKSSALSLGVPFVWADPGIGFGKTLENNLDLLSPRFFQLASKRGIDLCFGLSRKSFLYKWAQKQGQGKQWEHPEDRDPLSKMWEHYVAACGARAIRTHKLPG